MKYNELRNEIKNYYSKTSYENAKKYLEVGTKKLDELYDKSMSAYDMKVLQYKTITDIMKPVLFENAPFYFETGIIPGFSDGARDYRGNKHIGGWTYWRNYHWLIGDLLGYNEHHKWFGEKTKSTPDGRVAGDLLKFGIGQSAGRDRNDLTALLNSIALLDKNAISCGSTVTNVSLDEQLIKNDEYFDKTVDMFETYFKNGGIHFQLTYVSKEDLLAAKKNPENYGNLRVRVTGFSDYFVKLKDSIQNDIIERTVQNK